MKKKVIFLVDMESFYASVEKADNSTYRDRPVVVSGDPERRSGVILAACPLAKREGIKNGERLWEAQQKCPEAIVVRPRMQRYIDVSLQITEILEQFTDLVEPFSIDEVFVDVTGSQRLFGGPHSIARQMQKEIMDVTGVRARVGIGTNKVLAKTACDNFAKKNKNGIFELTEGNLKEHAWPLPVGKLFGVGSRMERHFLRLGIRTIGHLANFPVEQLKKKWGVNGQVLWMTANGKDHSPVTTTSHDGQKAIGHGLTLPRDYSTEDDIKVVLLELCEEVCRRARDANVMGSTISVSSRGADFNHPTGFHRQVKLLDATNNTMEMFTYAWRLFLKHWDRQPIRRIGVNMSSFGRDNAWQLSLFENRENKREIGYVMDHIKDRFGATAIMRASSLKAAGQAFERAEKIGGHYR
ncbi:DNA polymerase IV [Desertibacillus haloalkaliphilus]|uniref:DNA polymerase IV n=1 Tax=Desertibacillus haloalkaliphilus TaxID=1328930 RepID=UPI001C25523D|nr:DNA polymerase IV [Desertibacillus haloalkaliphilus]MBU8908150.1 DNA polymerase IV [Desertibacillus haloalkaliphilus]